MQPTPMMAQYLNIKEQNKDAILFFRLGDFYEMFYDDAIIASKELEITLTRRDKKNAIPMCGVPYHSASGYIERLIEKGYKVAICEQMENPREVKGMVKREVVQVVTPGTVMDTSLDERASNYLLAITGDDDYTLCYCDISTGILRSTITTKETVLSEIASIHPREIITDRLLPEQFLKYIQNITPVITQVNTTSNVIPEQAKNTSEQVQHAVHLLFDYVQETQKRTLDHIEAVDVYEAQQFMRLDMYAKRNLELTESIRLKTKKGTLLSIFNQTKTPMGHRLLKEWIERPLIHEDAITERLNHVALFNEHYLERNHLMEALSDVYDIERLVGRISYGSANAKDLIQLKMSLEKIPEVNHWLNELHVEWISNTDDVLNLLNTLNEEPPTSIKEGNIFKSGVFETLDTYRSASTDGKKWLSDMQQRERERTNIKSLKVGYNKVFGYYIEISKANLHNFDADQFGYVRKQTLTNAERFVTNELKEKESLILDADEKAIDFEYDEFIKLRDIMKKYMFKLQAIAKKIATLDCLLCFSEVAMNNDYTMPHFSKTRALHLVESRHPVVEQVMDKNNYVPNDCELNDDSFIYLITGPNMSGKSTYMRQVALISIMAQMGSFVPCNEAVLPIFDQIYTRIGAADDLVSGQSTFMVEMLEAKNALTGATKDSLIIFDEIGRGTSTYDGLSLAQAMIEYVHHHIHAKTLFSTHYHELVELEHELPSLKNIHVAAKEYNGELIFLHKVQSGAVENSYGIHVARLAELPNEILNRASQILQQFEISHDKKPAIKEEQVEFDLFNAPSNVESKIKELNINQLTPIEALNILQTLQNEIK